MGRNRKTKGESRAEHYTDVITRSGTDGAKALREASNWLLSEISIVCEVDPQRAEAIRWNIARQLLGYSSRVPRLSIELRRGLTTGELEQILNPWAKPPKGSGTRVV